MVLCLCGVHFGNKLLIFTFVMNILPKKRWHVRTKENIARVRKDEAEAAEKEREENFRIETADREARLNLLKQKSKQKLHELGAVEPAQDNPVITSKHINLFEDLDNAIKTTNKDHDNDLKEKKEEYEKKIGYLTYLGQDTNETLKKKNWYEVAPESTRFTRSNEIKDTYDKLVLRDEDGKPKEKKNDEKNGETCWKQKQKLDPINVFKKYCHGSDKSNSTSVYKCDEKINQKKSHIKTNKNISKYPKTYLDNSKEKIFKLREARLKREREEKYKTEMFLSGLNVPSTIKSINEQNEGKVKPKYNSQFNPELARQNYR